MPLSKESKDKVVRVPGLHDDLPPAGAPSGSACELGDQGKGTFCTAKVGHVQDMVHPENRWGDLVEGMSDAQLVVMRGPDRDVFHHNVPRLEVDGGQVSVSYERGAALYS